MQVGCFLTLIGAAGTSKILVQWLETIPTFASGQVMFAINHRRFRFSLRALFVLTAIVCGWCAYQLHWIRERHQMLENREVIDEFESSGATRRAAFTQQWAAMGISPAQAPGPLWLFGERGVTVLGIIIRDWDETTPAQDYEVSKRALKLFPESEPSWKLLWRQTAANKSPAP